MSDRMLSDSALLLWQKAILYATLLAGAALRIVIYLQNRSLFLDEANLARNIAERSGQAFFQPLDYEQFAPPFFSLITKLFTQLFGLSEYGLRLLPLLAGLAALWLFFQILQQLKMPWIISWWLLWLFSFQPELLRYATECKQYGTDVFATVLLVYLASRQSGKFSWDSFWKWALLGATMIWFSMPSVFVLAGLGIYFLVKHADSTLAQGKIILTGSIWAGSFLLYFFLLLKPDAESIYLRSYHDPWFLPLWPASSDEWRQLGILFVSLIKPAIGFTNVAIGAGILALGAALFYFFRKKEKIGLLFTLPVLLTLLASGLHYYSLLSRLTLFLIPLMLLWMGFGFRFVWQQRPIPLKIGVIALLILTASLRPTYIHFFQAYLEEEIRPALAYVHQKQQPGEQVFLGRWVQPAYAFYSEYHPQKEDFLLENIMEESPSTDTTRVWLIFTHLTSTEELGRRDQRLEAISKTHKTDLVHTFEKTEVYLGRPR